MYNLNETNVDINVNATQVEEAIIENEKMPEIQEEANENSSSQTPLEFAKRITDLAYEGFKLTFEEFKQKNYESKDEILEGLNSKFLEILDLSHWTLSAVSVNTERIKERHSIEYNTALDMLVSISRNAGEGIEICEEHIEQLTEDVNNMFNEIQWISKLYLDQYFLNS